MELSVEFPLTLEKKYLGFVDYLLLKQELSQKSPFEGNALGGMRLITKFFVSFWSIRQGYKDYRALEDKIREHASMGYTIVLAHDANGFTVGVRASLIPPGRNS